MLCYALLGSAASALLVGSRRGEARARWRRAGALGCRRWLSYWLSYWLWLSFRCWVSALALPLAWLPEWVLASPLVRHAPRRAASGAIVSDKRTWRAGPGRRSSSLPVARCSPPPLLAIVLVTPQGARPSLAPFFLLGRVSWGRRRRRRRRRCRCCRCCCLVVSGRVWLRSEAAKRSAGP